MNRVERVLDEELTVLLERLTASVPAGCLEVVHSRYPALRRKLEECEGQLAALRGSLLEGYGRWRRALDDLEHLWALAAWHAVAPADDGSREVSDAA
jgi:hypothetical protein